MGKGLQRHAVPVFVSGGLDNRTDPKLVAPGAVVLADECYYAQTGALTKRNATTAVTSNWADQNGNSGSMNAIQDAFLVQGGRPALIASGTGSLYRELLGFSDSSGKWMRTRPGALPSVITSIEGIEAASNLGSVSDDMLDPDLCVATFNGNKTVLMCWQNTGGAINLELRDAVSGVPRETQRSAGGGPPHARCAATGKYACAFGISNLGSVFSYVYDTSTTAAPVAANLGALAAVAGAAFLEAMPRPGGTTIILAFTGAAGGVTLLEFNPATSTVITGPTNIAAVDATQCIGLLDDTQSSGSYWLASVGTTDGAVVRQLTTAFAVTATRVIDNSFATTTSNVRNITGYLSSATEFVIFFDGSIGATYQGWIIKGTWIGGVATVGAVWQRGAALLSKAFKYDGRYYLVANYMASAANVQETQVVLADPVPAFSGNNTSAVVSGIQLPLVGGGKTNRVSCLGSVYALDSTNYLFGTLRKTSLTAANGAILTARSVVKASMAMTTVRRRPREIGGITYIPGGLLSLYDGVNWRFPAFAAFPEIPTAITPGGGGSMTSSGQYDYVAVYRDVDATGRVYRSAASPVASVTLGAGNTSAQVVVTTLRLDRGTAFNVGSSSSAIELYRRGPAASGATNFNRVAATGSFFGGGPGGDSITFTDTVSDAVANTGETLYDTGGVLDNFSPPSCNIMETWNGRVFLVDPEYPTRIWFSKQLKPGLGLAFNPLLTLLCEGDSGGPITALCAMDQYLVIFKRSSILVVTGDGPNDANQGQFSQAQIVTTATGTTDPGSICLTPDGVMFHDYRQGFMLLTRGLSLEPVGYPIAGNNGINNNGVSDSALVPSLGQARFLSTASRVLVWHYILKKWTRISAQSAGIGLISIPGLEATNAGGALYEIGSSGAVRYEGLGFNVSPENAGLYQQQIFLPKISFDGIGGFVRAYGAHFSGTTLLLSNDLEILVDYDEEGSFLENHGINMGLITDTTFAFEVSFSRQKCRYIQIAIILGPSGAFSLTGVRFVIGTKGGRGMFPVATTQRIPPQ